MNTPVTLEERNDSELGRILRNERFTQLFQPIVDAMEQRTVCYEVFTRGVYPLSPRGPFSGGQEGRASLGGGALRQEHRPQKDSHSEDLSGTICFLNISPELSAMTG